MDISREPASPNSLTVSSPLTSSDDQNSTSIGLPTSIPTAQVPIPKSEPIDSQVRSIPIHAPNSSIMSTPVKPKTFGLTYYKHHMPKLFIKAGLIFVYSYAAISMSINPVGFLHYIPAVVGNFIPLDTALKLFAAYEILLSLWLLSGKKGVYSSIAATVTIFGITVTNTESFNIVFRNVSIFFSALALVYMEIQDQNDSKASN